MNLDEPTHQPAPRNRGFFILLALVTVAFGWILVPFYGSVLWAAIIAILFAPLNRHLLRRFGGRPTWAALGTLGVVLVIVILPLLFLTGSLINEGANVYARMQSGELNFARYFERIVAALPQWLTTLLDRFGLSDLAALQSRITAALSQGSQAIASKILGIGQDTLDIMVGLTISLYLAFFLLRDGKALARRIRDAVPLDVRDKQELFGQFATVIRATVKGNVVVAVTQGALGGLAFWVLGIAGALVWAVVMAFLSLLPAVGAGLVWLPVAAYLLATGATWQGMALMAYGVLVIGLVDNVLRPVLVGKDTKMPDYVVLISTLGGLAVFGLHGFVIGPVIAAMFISVWNIFTVARGAAGETSR